MTLPECVFGRAPSATAAGTIWRFVEEFDTTEPVADGLPENYIERIVSAYAASGRARKDVIGHAPSLLMDAKPIGSFAIEWLESHAGGTE